MASRYWVGGSGTWDATTTHWSATSGGANGASVPTSSDDVFFDANSGTTPTVSGQAFGGDKNVHDLDLRGFTGSISAAMTEGLNIYGSFNSGTTAITYNVISFLATTTGKTVTTNGTVQTASSANDSSPGIYFSGVGGGWTLQDNLNNSNGSGIEFDTGTFDANGHDVIAPYFYLGSSTASRTVNMGSGTWTVTGSFDGGSDPGFWDVAITTGLTLNCSTSTIKFTDTSALSQPVGFNGGGCTYNNLWFARGAATGTNYIPLGSNTFNQIKDTGTAAHGLSFLAGATQTTADFQVTGSAGNLVTIDSCDSGRNASTATHALTHTGSVGVSCDYLSIQHSVASPGSTWYAGTHSTNNQGVASAGSGWVFTGPPTQVIVGGSSAWGLKIIG